MVASRLCVIAVPCFVTEFHNSVEGAFPNRYSVCAHTLATLGLSGFAPGELPKRWTCGWAKLAYVPFASWPRTGHVYEATYGPLLLAHFHTCLCAYEVPLNVKNG